MTRALQPLWFIVLAVTMLTVSCADRGPTTGSESHWLRCQTDRDCQGHNVCYGGYCTDPSTVPGIQASTDESRTRAMALSAAGNTTCAVMSDGEVFCWGADGCGEPAEGDCAAKPVRVPGLEDAVSVSISEKQRCAVLGDTTVQCWIGSRIEPMAVDGLNGVLKLASDEGHTCALRSDRTVFCWGEEGEGEQPDDGLSPSSLDPVRVAGVSDAIDLAPTCALHSDGTVSCWSHDDAVARPIPGIDDASRLVSDDPLCVIRESGKLHCRDRDLDASDLDPRIEALENLDGVTSVAIDILCATASGEVWCVESAPESESRSWHLRRKASVSRVSRLAGGTAHACALEAEGRVKCWGSALYGQLGNGVRFIQAEPMKVPRVAPARQIGASRGYSCSLGAEGMSCWGDRFRSAEDPAARGAVMQFAVSDAVELSAGYGEHRCITEDCGDGGESTCVRRGDGQVSCLDWTRLTPVPELNDATAISTADGGCALTGADGQIFCWNDSDTSVSTMTKTRSVAAGDEHTCAIDRDGIVRCVGTSGIARWDTPTVIESLPPAQSISAGIDKTCAVVDDGRIFCWGEPHLGDGTNEASDIPRQVAGIDNAIEVATANHTCALLETGRVRCWGAGAHGQLGNGITTDQLSPGLVSDLENVRGVAVGKRHSCAVVDSGGVFCWGSDEFGRVSGGRPYQYDEPVEVHWPTVSEITPERDTR